MPNKDVAAPSQYGDVSPPIAASQCSDNSEIQTDDTIEKVHCRIRHITVETITRLSDGNQVKLDNSCFLSDDGVQVFFSRNSTRYMVNIIPEYARGTLQYSLTLLVTRASKTEAVRTKDENVVLGANPTENDISRSVDTLMKLTGIVAEEPI